MSKNISLEYENLIRQLDSLLGLMRTEYLEAGIKNKKKWERKIDDALDERLRLMNLRDSNQ
jgi:hypothetical protein